MRACESIVLLETCEVEVYITEIYKEKTGRTRNIRYILGIKCILSRTAKVVSRA